MARAILTLIAMWYVFDLVLAIWVWQNRHSGSVSITRSTPEAWSVKGVIEVAIHPFVAIAALKIMKEEDE